MSQRWAPTARLGKPKRTRGPAGSPGAACLACRIGAMVFFLLAGEHSAATLGAQASAPPAPVGTSWEIAVQRAQEHIRYGLNLGSRRAVYSSQTEFLQALRVIARELDAMSGNHVHETALTEGWRALATLEDAKGPSGAEQASPLRDPNAAQATVSDAGVFPGNFGAYEAMQRQLRYAQERLAFSGGQEPTASMALYALGRSYIAAAEECPEEARLCGPKALALYRAALDVDATNGLAVNEQAVLLARCGQLREAEDVLLRGVSVAPQPQMWHNLAMIHEKQGNKPLAQEDRRRRDALAAAWRNHGVDLAATGLADVHWVEPTEFARCSESDDFGQPSQQDSAATPQPTSPEKQADASARTSNSWPLVPKGVAHWITGESAPGTEAANPPAR